MTIKYVNGFINEASLRGLNDFEQVRNAIIVAECEGYPFRGDAEEMARDVIAHILKASSSDVGLIPVIVDRNSSTDSMGNHYTTKVVFQAVE